jgi:pimeloyl-ACP methyl ester carboxylesterase
VKLAGTIAAPRGAGRHPAAIFVTGSGAQDRDETIVGHKPFAVIADHLARYGIASLRCDDRGVGGSSGVLADSTTLQLIGDVRAMIAFLAARTEIDPQRIGLLGHSEGASIAAGAAADNDGVSFLVLLAAPGMRGDEVLRVQLEAILQASGVGRASIDAQLAVQKRLLEMLIAGAAADDMRPVVLELVELQSGPATAQSKPMIDATVAAQMAMLGSKWFRSAVAHDPQESLRRVRCPVLAVTGDLDLQAPPEQNLRPIRHALREAENERVTIRRFEALNHLLQRAKTGLPDEYQNIEQTIDPMALEAIGDWISRQLRGEGDPRLR